MGCEESVRRWVETMVVGLNLCPFAKRELVKDRVRFVTTHVSSESELLLVLRTELQLLERDPAIETTLIIHPDVLQDFYSYSQFLNRADKLLVKMQLDGTFQIASFHPQYQFADAQPDAAENYTNRAPYPVLHLLREASLEKAITAYPDVDNIPQRNIELMQKMGLSELERVMKSIMKGQSK